jgi:hypothetical protein
MAKLKDEVELFKPKLEWPTNMAARLELLFLTQIAFNHKGTFQKLKMCKFGEKDEKYKKTQ